MCPSTAEPGYERWAEASRALDEQMAAAAERQASPPVEALRIDFDAQLDVTRAVIAFTKACPADGPDLDGLAGAAFVQALYQAVSAGLDSELSTLTLEWDRWLPKVGRWTPASSETPPPRPMSATHSRVLAAVDDWTEFLMDRTHDQVVEMLAAGGREVTETIRVGPDGQIIQHSRITLRGEQLASESKGFLPRLRAKFVRRKRDSP